MSGGTCCKCLSVTDEYRRRHWRVWQRRCNYSAFNGYRYTPSAWSLVCCLICRALWRTTTNMSDTAKRVRDALTVLLTTPATREWLAENDPKALRQGLQALGTPETIARVSIIKRSEKNEAGVRVYVHTGPGLSANNSRRCQTARGCVSTARRSSTRCQG